MLSEACCGDKVRALGLGCLTALSVVGHDQDIALEHRSNASQAAFIDQAERSRYTAYTRTRHTDVLKKTED